jgi:hypothetical protein
MRREKILILPPVKCTQRSETHDAHLSTHQRERERERERETIEKIPPQKLPFASTLPILSHAAYSSWFIKPKVMDAKKIFPFFQEIALLFATLKDFE